MGILGRLQDGSEVIEVADGRGQQFNADLDAEDHPQYPQNVEQLSNQDNIEDIGDGAGDGEDISGADEIDAESDQAANEDGPWFDSSGPSIPSWPTH